MKYKVKIICNNKIDDKVCGNILNVTVLKSGVEIWKNWSRLVITSGFNADKCKNCNHSTFSDLNISNDLKIFDEDDKIVELENIKKNE